MKHFAETGELKDQGVDHQVSDTNADKNVQTETKDSETKEQSHDESKAAEAESKPTQEEAKQEEQSAEPTQEETSISGKAGSIIYTIDANGVLNCSSFGGTVKPEWANDEFLKAKMFEIVTAKGMSIEEFERNGQQILNQAVEQAKAMQDYAKIYTDLEQRAANGEKLTEGAEKYMASVDKQFAKYGLQINEEGNVVKTEPASHEQPAKEQTETKEQSQEKQAEEQTKTEVKSEEKEKTEEPKTKEQNQEEKAPEQNAPTAARENIVKGDYVASLNNKGEMNVRGDFELDKNAQTYKNIENAITKKFPLADSFDIEIDASQLAIADNLYNDLQSEVAKGGSLNDAQKAFMAQHESNMKFYGLSHDENGNLVTAQENKDIDKLKSLRGIGTKEPHATQTPKTPTNTNNITRPQGKGYGD